MGRGWNARSSENFLCKDLVGSQVKRICRGSCIRDTQKIQNRCREMNEAAVAFHGLHEVEDQLRISFPDLSKKPLEVHGEGHFQGLVAELRKGAAYGLSLNQSIGLIGVLCFFGDSIV